MNRIHGRSFEPPNKVSHPAADTSKVESGPSEQKGKVLENSEVRGASGLSAAARSSALASAEAEQLLGQTVKVATQRVAAGMGKLRTQLDIRRELDRSLDAQDPAKILKALGRIPAVAELLNKPSGSRTYATIGDHTEAVLENLRQGLRHRPGVEAHSAKDDRPLTRHLFLATALHDIGKGHSVENFKNTEHQHAYTMPIAQTILKGLGYAPAVKDFVGAIVDHDLLADASRSLIPVPDAVNQLEGMAKKAQLPLNAFMDFAEAFYFADATAYPSVREKAFSVSEEGRVESTRPLYYELRAAVAKRAEKAEER